MKIESESESWDGENYIFAQKWLRWGLYIIGHKIDYNAGRGSEKPGAHARQKLTQVTPWAFFGPKWPFFAWTDVVSGMFSFCACTKALRYRVNEDNL